MEALIFRRGVGNRVGNGIRISERNAVEKLAGFVIFSLKNQTSNRGGIRSTSVKEAQSNSFGAGAGNGREHCPRGSVIRRGVTSGDHNIKVAVPPKSA